MKSTVWTNFPDDRRRFIGGSDARIIMGANRGALLRLWRKKRGEAEPQDYSGDLIIQLGVATEVLNRRWFERTTGQVIKDVQSWVRHPVIRWMAATLDGVVEGTGAVFMAQVQHNMGLPMQRTRCYSIIRDLGAAQVRFNFSAISTRRRSASERDGLSG
jgi:predicted phage-related endonuclease